MSYTSHRLGIATMLVCGFLWQSCQSRLHVTGGDASAPSAKILVDASTQTPESRVSLISATTGNRQASEISDEDKKPSAAALKIHKLRLLQNSFPYATTFFGEVYVACCRLFPSNSALCAAYNR